jgi:hypothetical protein
LTFGPLGLFDPGELVAARGRDAAAVAGPAAAWYFADEWVAIPAPGTPVAGHALHTRPMHDVRRWGDAHAARAPRESPPLVWIGAPDAFRHARIDIDRATVAVDDGTRALVLADRLAQNRSWLDASSTRWLAARTLAVRGERRDRALFARTLWPEDFRLGPAPPPLRALPDAPTRALRLRAWIREPIRADAPYDAATVWQRDARARWDGASVVALVLNGAQGDDDEAHAGHFALATGRIADDGSIGGWLVNNFYSLDSESEKGILAAPVPLDHYQGELNAGQSWYRPSWIVAAVLDDARAAVRVQSAFGRVFAHFWRHQLPYYHPIDNCTGITIDTLSALGLDLARRGPTSRIGAPLAYPALLARERSLARAAIAYDYLVTDRTRLLPALAVEALFEALWALAEQRHDPRGTLARELQHDLAALAVVRLPQFPSSRAFGAPPVVSLAEYRQRVPRDPAQRKIIALPERAFPDALRDADLLPPLPRPSQRVARYWLLVPLLAAALGLILLMR